ncbi:hypothetical protein LTR53_012033 [Teratosphaeriaceae sp. CCFEE 6253]|nr:hypothetical protein LTR53_012033 [Teratosphaeriaceae sp. CCFEE 6253]
MPAVFDESRELTSPCPSTTGDAQHPTLTSCKIISAEFFLTVKDTPEAKVGYLDGHIVDKKLRTGMLDADLRPKNDWVFQFLDYVRQRGDEAPLGEALSILYNARGARRPRQANAAALLATRKVVYVDSFQLSKP